MAPTMHALRALASSALAFHPFQPLRSPCCVNDRATLRIRARSWPSSFQQLRAAFCARPSGLKTRSAPAARRLASATSAASTVHAFHALREPSI